MDPKVPRATTVVAAGLDRRAGAARRRLRWPPIVNGVLRRRGGGGVAIGRGATDLMGEVVRWWLDSMGRQRGMENGYG